MATRGVTLINVASLAFLSVCKCNKGNVTNTSLFKCTIIMNIIYIPLYTYLHCFNVKYPVLEVANHYTSTFCRRLRLN